MTDEPPSKPSSPEAPEPGAGGISISPPQAASAYFPYPPGTSLVGQAVQIWQSPYPPPDAVERYEKICPGAFDRILGMACAHWLGFVVAIAALIAAIVSLLFGDNPWVAGLCLSVPVMAVAKALIDSAKAPSK
jgi:hypothetical protein